MIGNLTFNAIDVETANGSPGSICQVGIVRASGGAIRGGYVTLVNPWENFSPLNRRIHGIGPDSVQEAPAFPEIYEEIVDLLRDQVVVSHTFFDRTALERATRKYGLPPLRAYWLDSAAIARRAWPHRYRQRGYRLARIAADLGIQFQHHDALEDARAAAGIVLYACLETGRDIDYWLEVCSTRPQRGQGGRPT